MQCSICSQLNNTPRVVAPYPWFTKWLLPTCSSYVVQTHIYIADMRTKEIRKCTGVIVICVSRGYVCPGTFFLYMSSEHIIGVRATARARARKAFFQKKLLLGNT